jgi:hypothetical protein
MTVAAPQATLLHRWLADLDARTTPHFGQRVTWLLLLACYVLAALPFEMVGGQRQGPATLLSWLPANVLGNEIPFYLLRVSLLVGATLWLFQRALPWSCWLTTLSFTGLWSLHLENTTNGAHIFNAANQLLIVQSLWYTFFAGEIRRALAERRFWSTPLYPRWAFWLGLFYLGLFHTLAGVSKLLHSGLAWPNGVSLQLWAYWDGRPGSWLREAMIRCRPLVQSLQWLTLVFETAGILGVFSRRLRLWIGLMLVSFYLGVLLTFDYGFHMNLALTALYFLPFDHWFPAWSHRRRERWGVITWRLTDSYTDRIVAGLVARFDTAERIQIVRATPVARKAFVEQSE